MLENPPSGPVDPQARDFLDRLAAAGLPTIDQQSVAQARTQMDVSTRFLGRPPRVSRVEDRRISGPGGDIPLRVVIPAGVGDGPSPVVVYFHGGGWVVGDLASHEGLCRALANASGAVVVSVGYRLAPEHPFPAAVEDAYAAFAWFAAQAAEVGGDPTRVAVCGDSAGGNLAAAAALMARDRGGPAPAFQALAYPVLDCDYETESYRRFAVGHFLTRSEMMWYWDQYVPALKDRLNPYASPLRAADFSNLPPALVITAGYDVLRDEGERYAARLDAAGTPVRLSRYPGMIHGFLRRYPFFAEGRRAVDEVAGALRGAFGLTGPSRGVDAAG
ncbi:alpha/beta hydrolase [Paludisphaera mucosa]|uniref:Alpha/beta hydrolase n=1 Tax=Paludisphaera mucosa TaxID=3030827 RepID=A0ABT6F5Q6_9BACT|nr:alpha/beta hydrolase [Paludisphaera mucosa]MDG3002926.1 alpha/beta hydrolase [Paludisphaera mucosa]